MFLKKSITPQLKKKLDVEKWMDYYDNWLEGLWHGALRWKGSWAAQEAFLPVDQQWRGGPKS